MIIGADNNGLSPVRSQVIIWTNDDSIINWNPGNTLQWNLNENTKIIFRENVVCKLSPILFRPQYCTRRYTTTSWLGNTFRITGLVPVDPPHNLSVMRDFDIFFIVSLKTLLRKYSICRWSEAPWSSCHVTVLQAVMVRVFPYGDVIMGTVASQITSLTIVYSIVYSGADERKHQSFASLAFVRGIHRGPHKWPVTRKIFPFEDVIMWGKITARYRECTAQPTRNKAKQKPCEHAHKLYCTRAITYEELCAGSRYQGQGQVITSHSICGM